MKNRRWLNILKWVWFVIVFGGIVYYISKNYATLTKYLGSVSIPYMLLAVVLLLIGKLLMTRLSIQSVWGQDWKPTYKQMVYVYAMMQLAKYLPGGVWQYVGRFGLYRTNGLDNKQAGKSILVENIWMVISAIYFGAGTITISYSALVFSYLKIAYQPWIQFALILVIVAAWVLTLILLDWIFFRQNRQALTGILSILFTQLVAWFFIGAAFWIPLLSINQNIHLAGIAIGGFVLSWVVGYVTIFAPSGIGVREAVIAIILAGIISPEASVIYAAINRIVWLVAEISLGIFCELVFGSGKLSNIFKPGETVPKENIQG